MRDKPSGQNFFFKNLIWNGKTGYQTLDGVLELSFKNVFCAITDIGKAILEDIHKTEDNILSIHDDMIFNKVSLFTDDLSEILNFIGTECAWQGLSTGLINHTESTAQDQLEPVPFSMEITDP